MALDLDRMNGQDDVETRDTLFLLGGAAMVVFGAGLILSTPMVRRALGGSGITNLISAAVPDPGTVHEVKGYVTAPAVDTAAAVSRFVLDKSASRFTVRAFATGMLASFGHSPTFGIRNFSGEAHFSPDHLAGSSLRMEIQTDSLEVMDDIKAKDRREMESTMNRTVLETAKYPTILFASSDVSANQIGEGRFQIYINGELTLHGVAQKLSIPGQVTLSGNMLRASGDFTVLQSSYNIALVSVAGGSLKLKDELKFTFDIVARKQE